MKEIKRITNHKTYAQRVGKLSRKYNIPFDVCLALGDNEEVYPRFLSALSNFHVVHILTYMDLRNTSIARRKSGLRWFLDKELYETLGIDSMGKKNSKRIADFVADKYEKWHWPDE